MYISKARCILRAVRESGLTWMPQANKGRLGMLEVVRKCRMLNVEALMSRYVIYSGVSMLYRTQYNKQRCTLKAWFIHPSVLLLLKTTYLETHRRKCLLLHPCLLVWDDSICPKLERLRDTYRTTLTIEWWWSNTDYFRYVRYKNKVINNAHCRLWCMFVQLLIIKLTSVWCFSSSAS